MTKAPAGWRGPIGLLCALPELPGPDGFKFGIDLPVIHHVVQGEEVVMPLEVTAFIHPLDKRALAGKQNAPSVHGEEAVKERKSREIAPRSLQPQIIRAPGANQSGILILQVSLLWASNAEEKAGQGLVSTAPRAFARLVVFGNSDANIRKRSGSARDYSFVAGPAIKRRRSAKNAGPATLFCH